MNNQNKQEKFKIRIDNSMDNIREKINLGIKLTKQEDFEFNQNIIEYYEYLNLKLFGEMKEKLKQDHQKKINKIAIEKIIGKDKIGR